MCPVDQLSSQFVAMDAPIFICSKLDDFIAARIYYTIKYEARWDKTYVVVQMNSTLMNL